ncbi:MAG: hypothetical protein ACJAS1_006157 [Oleiphilaceae bacterium]|jgi:hypothetical protein
MSDVFKEHFKKSELLNKELLSLSGQIVKAGDVFHMDILTMAVVNRALELSEGFKDLILSKKFLCAAPLLRLQIDNLLRYSAAWLVENPHVFVAEVMKGTPVKKLKDASGKNMADFYLVQKLTPDVPWVKSVYDKTCGYIHFSESHFHKVMLSTEDNGAFSIGIGAHSKDIPEATYIEAVEAFNAATLEICKYVYGWLKTKDGSVDLSAHNK